MSACLLVLVIENKTFELLAVKANVTIGIGKR